MWARHRVFARQVCLLQGQQQGVSAGLRRGPPGRQAVPAAGGRLASLLNLCLGLGKSCVCVCLCAHSLDAHVVLWNRLEAFPSCYFQAPRGTQKVAWQGAVKGVDPRVSGELEVSAQAQGRPPLRGGGPTFASPPPGGGLHPCHQEPRATSASQPCPTDGQGREHT